MKRSLEELQKRYSSASSNKGRPGGPGFGGPGGPGRPGGPGGRRGPVMAKGKPKNIKTTVKRLMSYITANIAPLIFVLFLMLCNTLTSLAGSYMLRPIINQITDTGVSADERAIGLMKILCLLGAIYMVGVVSTYLQSRIMLHISQNAVEKIRNDLFDKLQKLPVRFYDTNTTGEIMSRFTNDIDNIEMMINNTVTNLISGTITLIGTFVMMIFTNIWLTMIVVCFIPIFAKGGAVIGKHSSRYYSGQQAALGAINGYIEETVTGAKVVKVFNHEETCGEEFELLNDDMREKQFKAQFYGGIMGPIMGNTSQISYAITAGVGGLLCLFKGFDIGGLSIFCNYSRQFSMPINMISQQVSTIFSALAGAERVFAVMDAEPEPQDKENASSMENMQGHVILDNVTFGYNPDKTILKNISLYAKPGQKIAFVGSTGAGKTTITNLLNRFYDIESGTLTIDGVDIKDIKM